MSKRNLLNLGLFLFIIILLVLVIYEPGKTKPVKPTTLTSLKSNDINSIKINRNSASVSEKNIEFKKTDNIWMIVKPHQLTANTFRIESILKLLSSVSFSQNSLEKLDKSSFGLDRPQVSITFNGTTKINFGHNKSLKNHRYVEINSTLHMIPDTFHYQLIAKAESYISHKVLSEKSNIIQLKLPNMTLDKKEGKWDISPKQKGFSADSVNQLISEWNLSQAYDINIANAQKNSKADIIIKLKNNKVLSFKLEKTKSSFNLINLNNNIRYILSKDRQDKLLNLNKINLDN